MLKLNNYIIFIDKEDWDMNYPKLNRYQRFPVCGNTPTHFPIGCVIGDDPSPYSCNFLKIIPVKEAIEKIEQDCRKEIDWFQTLLNSLDEVKKCCRE